jgi:hypothetical protein
MHLKTPLYYNVARPHCDAYSLIQSGVLFVMLEGTKDAAVIVGIKGRYVFRYRSNTT